MLPRTPRARRLAQIIDAICAVIAHHAARQRALTAFLVLIHGRLRRMIFRFDRLVLRAEAGLLKPTPPRATGRQPGAPAPAIPSGKAWLIRLVQPTAQYSGQIQAFLDDPAILALIAAAPQAGRIFRPLCRALGIDIPAILRLPPRPRSPKPRVEPPPPPPKRPCHPALDLPARFQLKVPGLRFSHA